MRRALVVVVLGGALVTAAACGTKAETTASPSVAATSAGPASAAPAPSGRSAKAACDAIDPEKDAEFKSFTDQYGKMITARVVGDPATAKTEQAKAAQQLKQTASGLRKVAAETADAEIKKNIVEVAAKMEASAADDAFFTTPKTIEAMESALTSAILSWYNPILASCS